MSGYVRDRTCTHCGIDYQILNGCTCEEATTLRDYARELERTKDEIRTELEVLMDSESLPTLREVQVELVDVGKYVDKQRRVE